METNHSNLNTKINHRQHKPNKLPTYLSIQQNIQKNDKHQTNIKISDRL